MRGDGRFGGVWRWALREMVVVVEEGGMASVAWGAEMSGEFDVGVRKVRPKDFDLHNLFFCFDSTHRVHYWP